MRNKLFLLPIVALAMAGCASRDNERAAVRGALIGAAGGAALTAIAGGDALQGAAIGAAGGAAIGVITQDGRERRVYRDRDRGRYWVDDRGDRHFLSGNR